ncbi:transposase [Flavobacterium sp.]|uniref:helix-turn-helix domain-containing protein n=1 Tax=Flavobacterium sp. TaxID=239 RepID=UPI00374DA198
MRILQLNPHLTTAELSGKLTACNNIHQRSYWQILLSVSFNPNKKAEEYAAFLGVTKSKVYKVVELYNKEGAGFTDSLKWGGRRSATSHMSFEDEEKMMRDLKIKAKDGKVLVAKHIRKIVETKVGKAVSDDYIWDLFKRHNWKKKMPRPEHPKKNKEKQEEFKKNSRKYWLPPE